MTAAVYNIVSKARSTGALEPRPEIVERDLDRYLGTVEDAALDCREQGHQWPPFSEREMRFKERGRYHIRTFWCMHCELVYREERWEITANGKGKVTRCEFIDSTIRYVRDVDGAQGYLLPPGVGRLKRNRLREHVVTTKMKGRALSSYSTVHQA